MWLQTESSLGSEGCGKPSFQRFTEQPYILGVQACPRSFLLCSMHARTCVPPSQASNGEAALRPWRVTLLSLACTAISDAAPRSAARHPHAAAAVQDRLFGCIGHKTHDFYHVEPQSQCLFDDARNFCADYVLRCAAIVSVQARSMRRCTQP